MCVEICKFHTFYFSNNNNFWNTFFSRRNRLGDLNSNPAVPRWWKGNGLQI